MRRFSLAVVVFGLAIAAASPVLAQLQDPVITSARQFAQQGNHDTAIAMLRSALTARPNDDALKGELVALLTLKEAALRKQLDDLAREIAALRGADPSTATAAPCLGTASVAPVRVGGSIKVPIKVRDVKPAYPAEAMANGLQGIVILEGTIDCDGTVKDVRILRGVEGLNEAAMDAVRQWQYRPTLLNGVPVPVIMTMTMTFTIR